MFVISVRYENKMICLLYMSLSEKTSMSVEICNTWSAGSSAASAIYLPVIGLKKYLLYTYYIAYKCKYAHKIEKNKTNANGSDNKF
jgi:hypothetical protein